MNNEYGFFSSQNDRKYSADDFCNVFNDFFTTGILINDSDNFFVDVADGLNLTVKKGTAYIKGHYFRPNSAKVIGILPNYSNYTRYSLVVLKLDYEQRSVYIKVSDGEPSENPVYPELLRNDLTYEIAIAAVEIAPNQTEISISDVTDLRGLNEYCGFITGTINQIDTSELFRRFNNEWNLLKTSVNSDIDGVLDAWETLGCVQTVANVEPDENCNIPVTFDDIPSGITHKRLDIQSGIAVNSGGRFQITFPIPFKEIPAIAATRKGDFAPSSSDSPVYYHEITTTGISFYLESSRTFHWIAIGELDLTETNTEEN